MKFLIAGGSSRIGSNLADKLLQQGHQVICTYRTSEQVNIHPNSVLFDAAAGSSLPENAIDVDGMAYFPGTINLKPFNRLTENDFLNDMQVNFFGAVNLLQQVIPQMKKKSSGSVVLISSVAVNQGMPFHTSIAAAKGALEGLARSLAAEFAPKIRVNLIAPSLVESPLSQGLISSEQRRLSSENRHPLKRIGRPDDIASMALYLLTQPGSWITGQTIGVDGGMSVLRV